MPINTKQFIEKARQKGISDEEINAYLQSKGEVKKPSPTFGSRETTGGVLGFAAPSLTILPQAVGLNVGARQNLKTVEGLSSTLQSQSDIAIKLLKQIQQ